MDFIYFASIFAIAVPLLIYLIIRITLSVTSFYLSRKFAIKLRINSIGIFSIKGIVLNLPIYGMSIEIECIALSSKWINTKYNSLIVVKLSDVRFQGNFISAMKMANESKHIKNVHFDSTQKFFNLSKLLWSLSPLRFISVSLHNVSLMQLGVIRHNSTEECLLHTTIQTLQFGLSTRSNSKTAVLTSQTDGIALKVLKRVKHDNDETCLAHLSLGLCCNLHVSETNDMYFEMCVFYPQIILYHTLPLLKIIGESGSASESTDLSNYGVKSLITDMKKTLLKRVTIKFLNTSLKLVRDSGQKALAVNISSIDADFTKTNTNELESRLIINTMSVSTTSSVLSSLSRINFICKIEPEKSIHHNQQLFLLSEISSCHLTYSEDELLYWSELMHAFTNQQKKYSYNQSDTKSITFYNSIVKEISKFIISFDINDISFAVKSNASSQMVTYGLNHTKISFVYNSDPLFKEIGLELLLETLWCWNGDKELRPANPNSLKKYHQKHVPLFLTMLLLKCRYLNLSDIRFHCVMDGLQASLDHFIRVLNRYKFENLSNPDASAPINVYLSSTSFQINLSSVNIFTSDIMLRLDSATIDSNYSKLTSSINGLAVTTMYAPSATLSCLKAAELIQHRIIYFSVVRLNCNHDINDISISLTEEVYVQWNVAFHLTLMDLYEELSPKIKKNKSRVRTIQSALINVKLDGKINIGALLSNSNSHMSFQTEYVMFTIQLANRLNLKSHHINMIFDDHSIMTVENINIVQVPESESNTIINRKIFVNPPLEVKKNRVLTIAAETVSISFPYKYKFSEAFNERFITIIKWLRLIHGKNEYDIENKSLPIDMVIKIQNASMEIADDPFEVKLCDNFELLEDEHKESLKRWEMLSKKIEERRRKNILLHPSKLEELHAAFAKQNSKTYIERSKKLYAASPMRTRLFAVKIDSLDLEIVADSAFNTYDKMVSVLKRIDKESPFTDDLRFNTIWCRRVNGYIGTGLVTLRDFPQAMMDVRELNLRGTVMGAEQEASNRAIRTCYIDVGPNFEPITLERSMTTLKFYHDLNLEASSIAYTHGACWEPVLQQLSLSFELITKPSLDPSPSLPWWDKMRFLFHGPLIISSRDVSLFFHASLNPYNSTELIEIALYKSVIEWLTGKILMKGNLGLRIHTASKYDECRIVYLPNVHVCLNLQWACLGNRNDHHSVIPCAPDKVPEYSSHQVHDSYRSFRSHNLNVVASLETKSLPNEKDQEIPSVELYNSQLRWLENKMFMISGLARLTRRGKLFGNVKPRKQPFGKIFKSIRVAIYLHKFKVSYWSSFNKQRGCEIISANVSHSAEHIQSLVTPNDGLIHRPKPVWDMSYMNTELSDVEIWLYKGIGVGPSVMQESEWSGDRKYFLSLRRVSYNRETKSSISITDMDTDVPIHRLVIYDLKGAWTKENRDVAFGLFDSYVKTQLLKRNLSTDALKSFKVEGQSSSSPTKSRNNQGNSTSPASTVSKGHAASMLQKLIAEAENSSVVYTEDIENAVATETPQLHGVAACQTNDVIQKNWLIELVNSQVMLRGCETEGYVIVSAAKAQIIKRMHRPVWKNRTLYSKSTWQGSLECMQYYATVDAGGIENDNITWLGLDNIEERNNLVISDLPDLVGSGHSVGGVVSPIVGTTDKELLSGASQIQLQRIISRCGCQFFYASYDENVDITELAEVPPLPKDDDLLMLEPWDREIAVDSFTLTHHDLEMSTNSQQFSMIVDLVNNLLLYVEPHKKEAFEKQQRIRFAMQLTSVEDQREPINQLQDKVRNYVAKLKRLEKESYTKRRALIEQRASNSKYEEQLLNESQQLDYEMDECKEELNTASEDLTLMINCFREAQLTASKTKERQAAAQEGGMIIASVIRRSEVCFKHASWRLTDLDGQLGFADLVLSNFLYSKVMKNDDSVDHSFELGYIHVSNLLPNQIYKDVLQPTELQPNIPLDRHRALRIFCRERAPVGGISVKEHLEVNVIPFTIGLTYAFFKVMLKFFFPDRETQSSSSDLPEDAHQSKGSKKKGNIKRDESVVSSISSTGSTIISSNSKGSNSVTSSTTLKTNKDNIEKMRERAQKNHSFVYIKIPEVPIRISYKGNKGIDDLHNVSLILPTIEYHTKTWTWLDLFMAVKSDSRRVLLSQALKQKFHISLKNKMTAIDAEGSKQLVQQDEEDQDKDKARLLLGDLAVPSNQKSTKSSKLSLFSHKK